MQPTQKLTTALRDLVALLEEEAARNPAFADRLLAITEYLPPPQSKKARKSDKRPPVENLPDVFTAYQEKGDQEFRFWVRSFDLQTLKALVKANGFDPGKASQRWNDPDKFISLIVEQTAARLRRGSSFLAPDKPTTATGEH